jgi:2,3-bisphosphoglycerate-dependent phosphoglycerate mutase
MARVLLIRHCQTTGQGPDSPLTERGREQALELAGWLTGRGIDRIVSSPYQRALDTIQPFARGAGLDLEVDARFAERQVGAYFESPEQWWHVVRELFADPTQRLDGGESGLEAVARGWPALEEVLAGGNAVTAVVAHGQMNTLLLNRIDATFGYDGWMAMTSPDVFEVWNAEDGVPRFARVWRDS